jgi:hypothetical protein
MAEQATKEPYLFSSREDDESAPRYGSLLITSVFRDCSVGSAV